MVRGCSEAQKSHVSLILCGYWTCPQHPSSHNPLLPLPHSRALASDMLARLAVGYAHPFQASGASEVCSSGTFGDIFVVPTQGKVLLESWGDFLWLPATWDKSACLGSPGRGHCLQESD